MRFPSLITALILSAAPAAAFAALPTETPAPYRAGEVIVKYRDVGPVAAGTAERGGTSSGKAAADPRAAVRSRMRGMGMRSRMRLLNGNAELMELPAVMDVPGAMRSLSTDPDVAYVEPNYLYFPLQTPPRPNDSLFGDLWGLHNTGQNNFACAPGDAGCPASVPGADLNMLAAWDPGGDGTFERTGSSDVVVAIIDTAFDTDHPDFDDNFIGVGNFRNPNPSQSDQDHGTLVAGALGARGNNGAGVAGTTWRSSLMPLKIGVVRDGETVLDSALIMEAVEYARDNGAHIINASFGGPSFSQSMKNLICSLDILFVTSAGNDDANLDFGRIGYPALYDCPNIITAAATNRQDNIASFSMYGPLSAHVAAPGLQVVTTTVGGGYFTKSQGGVAGTSFSAPYTAGIAALLRAHVPTTDESEIKARLIESGTSANGASAEALVAGGRIDAAQALDMAPRPSLTVDTVTVGNSADRLTPGETVGIEVTLANGWEDATGVTGTLSAEGPVTVTSGETPFGFIGKGDTASATFQAQVATVEGHHYVTFTLNIKAQSADGAYEVNRHFIREVAALELGGTAIEQRFQTDSSLEATLESSLYDEYHTWHVRADPADLPPSPNGQYTLLVRTQTGGDTDIDLLGRAGQPPRYLITLNVDPTIPNARNWFCTDDSGNCRDSITRVSGRTDGHEAVTHVFDGSQTPEDFYFTIVNFAQASFPYDLWAEIRAGDLRPTGICPSGVELCTPGSNTLTVDGLSSGAETFVYIRRGEYSVNGDPYTSDDGLVSNGDTIEVRGIGADPELTVGGITARFASGSSPSDPSGGGGGSDSSSGGGGGGGCTLAGGAGKPDPLLPLLVLLAGIMSFLRLPLPI